MGKKIAAGMVFWLMVISLVYADSGPDLKEGMWEITVEMEIPGMPMKMPPTSYSQCIKKDQAIPHENAPDQKCATKDVTTQGNTVSWTMICTNPGGQMTGKGRVTYHDDAMDGSMTMEGQGMKMISHFKGHRKGACQ